MAQSHAVSARGALYGALGADGRLRVWGASASSSPASPAPLLHQYTPDLHLAAPPRALAWLQLAAPGSAKKGKKRKSSITENPETGQYVALGTTNGKILIYSIALAKVETVLETNSHSEITCLDWSADYGLYSSSEDNYVYDWNISGANVKNKYNVNIAKRNQTGDKVTAIKVVPHTLKSNSPYLVTASCQIHLWSLSPLVLLRTMVGHSSLVSSLSLARFNSQSKSYIVSCTKTERLLSFWDITVTAEDTQRSEINGDDKSPTKKQRKKSLDTTVVTPSYNFVLEDAPKMIDLCVRETDGASRVNLAAVTRSGVMHYYGHILNGASTKPIKPSVTIHVSTAEAKPMPLMCCKFTELTTEHETGELVVGYEVTPSRMLFERVIPDTKNKTQVLIRADPSVRKSSASERESEQHESETTTVTYAQPSVASRKRVTPGGKVEVPMESRLANLALETKSRSGSAVNQNLTKLLVQGLHSKDKMLILTVLQRDDSKVAVRTVSALPPVYVAPLLEQLTEMASRKTSQCKAVCVWLSALIRCHSALLLATLNTSATSDKFSQLLAVLTQRRSHLCQLLNLKGRLELTISQRASQGTRDADTEAILDYVDTSSSDSEDMDVENRQEWESDGSEAWDDSKMEGSSSSEEDDAASRDGE